MYASTCAMSSALDAPTPISLDELARPRLGLNLSPCKNLVGMFLKNSKQFQSGIDQFGYVKI